MKYTIDWCEAKQGTGKNGKPYTMTTMTLTGEDGSKHSGVTTFDAVVNGQEIEGTIVQKGQYLNFESAQKANAPRGGAVSANIEKFQDRKAEQIEKAQDRTAAIWAKYGACELVAHHPAYKHLNEVEVVTTISRIASQIINDDLTPF